MHKEKAIVIGQDKGAKQAISVILKINNIGVTTTTDAQHAKSLLERDHYDIILCDVEVALDDEAAFIHFIKNSQKFYKTPFVVLASEGQDEKIRACIDAGAEDAVKEPYSGKFLVSLIKTHLEKSKKHAELIRQEVNEKLFTLLNRNFSQEFLTPLNGIINSALLFQDLPGSEGVEGLNELIQIIYSAGFRMQRTTQNICNYALLNLENSEVKTPTQPGVVLSDLLQRVLKTFDSILMSEFKKIEPQIIQDGTCQCNEEFMRVVFTELIDNAIKFSQSGFAPEVALTALGNQFSFSVTSQSGRNINFSREDIAPFRKFHDDLSRNGMGLGLYITKRIAETMGYQFLVEKEQGRVTFTVSNM